MTDAISATTRGGPPVSIAVCCDTPLVSTMIFSKAEWYCIKCRTALPLFNAERINWTPELEKKSEANDKWFREVTAGYIPPRCFMRDCQKCDTSRDEYHIDHATKEELEKSKTAYANLHKGKS